MVKKTIKTVNEIEKEAEQLINSNQSKTEADKELEEARRTTEKVLMTTMQHSKKWGKNNFNKTSNHLSKWGECIINELDKEIEQ